RPGGPRAPGGGGAGFRPTDRGRGRGPSGGRPTPAGVRPAEHLGRPRRDARELVDRRDRSCHRAARSVSTAMTPAGFPAADQRPVPVYDSARRRPNWIEEAVSLWAFRGLIHELVIRDIKVRYKRSVLGILWTMLAPLLNMIALTLVFSSILRIAIQNYPVY